MPIVFELMEPDDILFDRGATPMSGEASIGYRRETVHCLCGKFAKYRGGRNYYNGWHDCYSFDVECKSCGIVTIECV